MKRKSLLIISMMLVFTTLFSMLAVFPVSAESNTENAPELVHTLNFSEDSKFSPVAVGNAANNFEFTAGDNGASLTITGKSGGEDQKVNFWGGTITGLTADETTVYTMIYKARANGTVGKNNSIGVGGWIVEGDVEAHNFYNNYTNHNTVGDNESIADRRAALSLGGTKIGSYVMFSGLAEYAEDSDGFVTMKQVYDGANKRFTSYILAKDKTGENDADWIKIETQPMTLGENDAFGFMIYAYYKAINTTLKDVKIYKQISEGPTLDENVPAFSGGNGSESDPFQIATKEDLVALANYYNNYDTTLGICYQMTADVDLGAMAWTPIGNDSKPFTGIFDGNGKTVSNFTITADETYGQASAGFFGAVSSGTVKNLKIATATITTSYSANVGAFVGHLTSDKAGVVSGCVTASDVTVTANGSHVGDLKMGGIVGYCRYTVEYCENNATVKNEKSWKHTSNSTNKAYIGGVVGGAIGTVKYCVNNGTVTTEDYEGKKSGMYCFSGGILGEVNPWNGTSVLVEGCINNGTVSNFEEDLNVSCGAGGIIGNTFGGNNTFEARLIKNNYNFGAVVGTTVGQIIGHRGNSDPQVGPFTAQGNYGIQDLAIMVGNMADTDTLVAAGMLAETAENMKAQDAYKAVVKAIDDNLMFALSEMPAPAVPVTPPAPSEPGTTPGGDEEDETDPPTTETDPPAPETDAPVTEAATTTPAEEEESGCKSSASVAVIAVLSILGAGVTVCKKKN